MSMVDLPALWRADCAVCVEARQWIEWARQKRPSQMALRHQRRWETHAKRHDYDRPAPPEPGESDDVPPDPGDDDWPPMDLGALFGELGEY